MRNLSKNLGGFFALLETFCEITQVYAMKSIVEFLMSNDVFENYTIFVMRDAI